MEKGKREQRSVLLYVQEGRCQESLKGRGKFDLFGGEEQRKRKRSELFRGFIREQKKGRCSEREKQTKKKREGRSL